MKKSDLQAGDIILFPPHKNDFIAQAIAFLTDGEVNHAALCYPSAGELMIAESILKDGLVLNPFAEHIEAEYPLRICRLKGCEDLKPVLEASRKYLEEKNAYPNFNLGLLGILLLFKKFAPPTWKNQTVYRFAVLVSYELMLLVRTHKFAGKHPMSCSQFVAQCFTDAGKEYDLKFDQMTIAFDKEVPKDQIVHPVNANLGISPIEMLERDDATPVAANVHFESYEKEQTMTEEEKIKLTSEFIAVAGATNKGLRATKAKESNASDAPVPASALNRVTMNILRAIYELQTGRPATHPKEAIDYLKSSTARNFFVSPQDMLVNCPDSLAHIGNLSY